MQPNPGFFLLAYLLMVAGLVGAILPLLPGPVLIWIGALVWAWADGFARVGWPTLLVLAALMVLAWGSDLLLTTAASRKAGASWKAIGAAMAGGILGALLLSGLPIVGTISGALVGAVAGVLLAEYLDKRNWKRALRVGLSYIAGWLASSLLEVILSLLMLGIFAWQAFF